MKRSLKLSVFAALAALVFAVPAQADRRDGLNGNVLIEDYNDVFTYPQRAGHSLNVNRVRLNHEGGEATSATIGVKNGKGGWGVGINRLAPVQDPTQERATATVLEAVYSGGDWGLGLTLGKGEATVDGDGNTAMRFGILAGYTIKNVGEMSIGLGMDNAENAAGTKFSDLTVGVNLRGYKAMQPKVDFGYTVAINHLAQTQEPDGADKIENSATSIELGAGPVYKVGKGIVALHATVGYAMLKNGDDEGSQITIPGMNVAFETPLNDWVEFRAGAGYKFVMTSYTPDGGDELVINHADADVEQALQGTWAPAPTGAMGLSAHWDKFRIDVAVERDFLINGPYLLTGNRTGANASTDANGDAVPAVGFASKIAATYQW